MVQLSGEPVLRAEQPVDPRKPAQRLFFLFTLPGADSFTTAQLKFAVNHHDFHVPRGQLQRVLDHVDAQYGGRLTFPAFCDAYRVGLHSLLMRHGWRETQLAFLAFDRGAKGYVTVDDLQEVLRRISPVRPDSDRVARVFAAMDRDGSGHVSYAAFLEHVSRAFTDLYT
eukprot:TRINITY_DN4299_c0_g1_i1.p2 TRINITY_DN4299_c0_g1~~TRINITY_DN4299_c0_g1_i1.p2  ORF type:complete len:169 (+),score=46.73 TRINITY_DN4299_c0_g1_i1:266-772(+)